MLINANVMQAPANPEIMYLALRTSGKTVKIAGITNSAVKSAMTPAANPRTATIRKIFILSFNFFHLALHLISKPLFSLTYIFLSNTPKSATLSFNWKIKAQNPFRFDI